MKNELSNKWLKRLDTLNFAFQPILNINSGKIFAVEALLRNYKDAGFNSIFNVFDKAYHEGVLYTFDIRLREKAVQKFTLIENYQNLKLFYNLDNRLLEMPDFSNGNTKKILDTYKISQDSICFEISERHEISRNCNIQDIISHYKNDNFCIAIDDFGVGYSGYKLLYDSTPDIIKIDRFFLQDIHDDHKKKLMVKSIVSLAMQLGIKIIAEGVETKEEYLLCKNIGCQYIQGFFIQKPTKNVTKILNYYENIKDVLKSDKRTQSQSNIILQNILQIEPLTLNNNMQEVIEYFKEHKNIENIPILNHIGEPIGILQEKQIKDYIYSPYGRSLLLNKTNSKSKLKNLIIPCARTDVHNNLSNIIELYSNNPDSVGVIITKENKYYGFLSSRAIIEMINNQNILYAREQNPLTKLPGNIMIEEYMNNVITVQEHFVLCYFDLDNFKAFNDAYGFRNGDRVIQLFADIIKKHLDNDFFKAHVGGDDFFCASQNITEVNLNAKINEILSIIQKFTNDVKDFYSLEDKMNGYIETKDRDGEKKKFPLLTVSASIIVIEQKSKNKSLNTILSILSAQKKVAKAAPEHISLSTLL